MTNNKPDTAGKIRRTMQNRGIEPELLGMAEVEALTGRSRWSWRRDCYSGAVTSVKIGRRLLIPMSEIRRVIAENTRPRVEQ